MLQTISYSKSISGHVSHLDDGSNNTKSPQSEAQQFQAALNLASRYRTRDTTKSLIAIFANYTVIGLGICLSEFVSSKQYISSSINSLVYVVACLVIASRLRAFENLVHEASHYNLFPSPSTHYKLEFLYSFPVFRLLKDYRHSHSIHHNHLGDPTKDPDLIRILDLGLDKVPERPVYFLLFLPLSGFVHYEYLTTTFLDFWTSPAAPLSKTLFWALVLLTTWATGHLPTLGWYYAVPFFGILPVTRYWAEASEHLGMDLSGRFGNSRSNLGLAHLWYMHPHNDGYHAVHHLYSQVPFHELPAAHAALMEGNEAFRTGNVVSYGFLETFRQMAARKMVWKNVVGGPRRD
ncbi:hypothetical protein VPNG_09486 [Cytospora leucostoma]|uniref:Fatty acid desaturase domain-containing protein n=1 Tax=Cytospora leucostoma TaxID=1230097 RepID=A0A423VVD1_9PEZI|nr:hypothetical protein VPNG_09486 [Cytospora leucostoma]